MKKEDENLNSPTSNNYRKSLLIFISILIGVIGTLAVQHINKQRNNFFAQRNLDDIYYFDNRLGTEIFDDSFLKEMTNMEDRMNQAFENHRKYLKKAFSDVERNGKLDKSSVFSREDEKYYYYELNFSGFKKEDIEVKIENGMLSFSAEDKKETENKNDKKQKISSKSSFSYSFSLPKYDIKKEPEIVKSDNKITVKLSKIKVK